MEIYPVQVTRTTQDKKKNNSGFRLVDICKNHNLTILNGRYGQDKNLGSMTFRNVSTIDYTMVSTESFKILQNFQITDLDRIFSDGHSFLSTTITINPSCALKHRSENRLNKNAIYLNQSDYQTFIGNVNYQNMHTLLTSIRSCDNTVSREKINDFVSQISNIFNESALLIQKSRTKYANVESNPSNKPWFGHECKSARKKYYLAKKLHNRSKSDTNRQKLIVASKLYKKTMNKHINKHLYAKRKKLRHMHSHDPKEYWKFLNSLKSKTTTETPSANEFFDYFQNIYSFEHTDNEFEVDEINFESGNESLNKDFTAYEIDKCIRKLKNSKSPGFDGILNEYLKLTKEHMLPIYVSLFNLILNTGHIPEQWMKGKIKPIYKNNGDSSDPNNYRPITILSCLGKLFTALLSERLNAFLDESGILCENQAGFRKRYSTSDHIFVLHALIEIMKFDKKKLFCSFVDFSKAFDSVWRVGLWRKLIRNFIDGKFFRVIHNLYVDIKACVSINNETSLFFPSKCGVRQGDNLSPVLFSMFLNDLEDHMIADRIPGITIDSNNENLFIFIKIFILLYADDTVILADNPEAFQNSLNSFSEYCREWKLSVNKTKTKVMIFGARKNSFVQVLSRKFRTRNS